MSRPTSQAERIRKVLADGAPHSTVEIMERIYGGSHLGIARIGARIYDLKEKGCDIASWRDAEESTVWWYQMKIKPRMKVEYVNIDGVMHARPVEV